MSLDPLYVFVLKAFLAMCVSESYFMDEREEGLPLPLTTTHVAGVALDRCLIFIHFCNAHLCGNAPLPPTPSPVILLCLRFFLKSPRRATLRGVLLRRRYQGTAGGLRHRAEQGFQRVDSRWR